VEVKISIDTGAIFNPLNGIEMVRMHPEEIEALENSNPGGRAIFSGSPGSVRS
jgi:hypothetical protein